MTLSNREQTLRAIRKAAREVARGAKPEFTPEGGFNVASQDGRDHLMEVIGEHLWEPEGEEERRVALEAFVAEREKMGKP